jgi:membrane protein insertase Oxa1/YidC/SpoIIIJ
MPKAKPMAAGEVPDAATMMQRNSIYLFPLLTLYFARSFPAGLALYWVVTTIFTIVQQYYVNKEKYNIAGVEKVMEKADKAHPEYHRSKKTEKEILEETSNKKGVSVTVRRKK